MAFCGLALVFVVLAVGLAQAVPSFARKYKTSCVTCHYAYPKLNAFGRAYKNNGYRFPKGQDPEMVREDPISLGAEAYKRVWPDGIWPADIPGTAPISFHGVARTLYFENNNLFTFEIPHELELLFGGTIGDDLSFFGEVELEHESDLSYEFLIQYDFNPAAHVRIGRVGLDTTPVPPTQEGRRLTRTHYNLADLPNQSGTWRMSDGVKGGIEFWGVANGRNEGGGLTYSVGVGNGQTDENNFDLNQEKDVFGRVTYKIRGLGEAGGITGNATDAAFYLDDSIRLGAYAHYGTAVDAAGDEDRFLVWGGDLEWWFRRLILGGSAMVMSSDYVGVERNSLAMFAEGYYAVYPWLIAYTRYEYTDVDVNRRFVDAEENFIPAVVVMIRANVKASIELKVPLDAARGDTGDIGVQIDLAF